MPNEPKQNIVELAFSDSTVDVMLTNDGQTQEQTECSKASGESRCRRVSRTTNKFGEVESESTSSNDGIDDTKLTVDYDKRDKYGNIEHVTAKDAFNHVRESTTVFDSAGVFAVKEINALGHETVLAYDAAFGVLKKAIDPNQLVTEWQYDSLGRETLEKRPDGSLMTTTYSRTKVDGAWQLSERTTTTGGADDETIFDSIGRPVRTFSYGPAVGAIQESPAPRIMQVIEYDRLSGKLAKTSVPTAEGTPDDQLLFNVSEFDSIGREIRHTTPWNATSTTAYDGFVIDSTDPLLQHTVTEMDMLGRPVTIADDAKGKTRYTYGPFNTLHTVTDPGGAMTKWTRDALGRPRSIEEPDRGTTTLVYNGFGELLTSTDALGRVVTFGMDALGRVETRTDKLGAQVATTTWKWDTAPNGIGRLHTVTSPDAIQSFSYTKHGQLEGMAQTVEGTSFAARRQYDDVGHVKSMDYPRLTPPPLSNSASLRGEGSRKNPSPVPPLRRVLRGGEGARG